MKAITPKKAHEIAKRRNIDIDDNQTTFYATNEEETEIYSFDTKKERDQHIKC